MIKRILSLLLASMMLLSVLAACGDADAGQQTTDTTAAVGEATTAPVETEAPETKFDPFANFPADLRYDGKTFTIHNANTGSSWYTRISVVSEEQTGDVINDSIYTRQRKVEERFGIEIVEVAGSSAANEIRTAVQANTQD
ncbi:MAG: hypothetical protein IJC15_01195, partial [Clostridia bacterium]|nr:hypothetical protein [Clostridia bacterium]